MATAKTCSICNKPLSINDQRIESFSYVAIETAGLSSSLRGKSSFKLAVCNDCVEKILLTPADEAEKELRGKLGQSE